MNEKLCKKCNLYKPENSTYFSFRKRTNKFESPCKECAKEHKKQYKIINKIKILEKAKTYRDDNKESINSKRKKAYPKYKIIMMKYKKNNKEKIAKKRRETNKLKYHNDPVYKMKRAVSSMIRQAIKKNNLSFTKYLPYTIEELKEYIENQFDKSWMTWENHGKYKKKLWDDNDKSTWTWQLDHITPQSDFTYTSMEEENFQKCWALSNLRPYSAKQNLLDGATRVRHK
jgi:hypothetical protein